MEFIIILIAVAIERWTPIGKFVRNFSWLDYYGILFQNFFHKIRMPAWLNLIILLIPLVALVICLHSLLTLFWYGTLYFLFSLWVLLYCLGSLTFEAPKSPTFSFKTEQENLIVSLLVTSNQNIFAILFWFACLGPIGAIIYRLTALTAQSEAEWSSVSLRCRQVLDWIPVRLVGLGCALVSHFNEVMTVWVKGFFSSVTKNENFLAQCGLVALEQGKDDLAFSVEDIRELSSALIDRTLVLWLVIMALVILL